MQTSFAGLTISLRACLLGAFICLALPANSAVPIKFRPGAALGCQKNVNRMETTGTLADIDQYEEGNSFEWVVVNESLPAASGLPDDKHVFLDVTSKTNVLPKDTSFNTAFTMRLIDLNGSDKKFYGLDSPAGATYSDNARKMLAAPSRYPSHVFVTASLKGTLGAARSIGDSPISDLAKSTPRFAQARFRMFFDEDGDLSSTSDQTLIAKFGTILPPDSASSLAGTTADKGAAALLVNWDAALPGVFADQNGNEVATGDADASDKELRSVGSSNQKRSKFAVDFKFECATSGPCTTQKGSILSFRLNMTAARSAVSVLTPSTTPAGPVCKADDSKRGSDHVKIIALAIGGVAVLVALFFVAKRMTRGAVD